MNTSSNKLSEDKMSPSHDPESLPSNVGHSIQRKATSHAIGASPRSSGESDTDDEIIEAVNLVSLDSSHTQWWK